MRKANKNIELAKCRTINFALLPSASFRLKFFTSNSSSWRLAMLLLHIGRFDGT
ncbi:unnamed protein product, partial [Ceratitis capitata]